MKKKKRRRSSKWTEDRFPTPLFRAIRRFYTYLLYSLSWPIRALTQRRGMRDFRKASIFRRLQYPFWWTLGFLLHLGANLIDLIVGWSRSRQLRALFYGLPSVLAIGLFIFIVAFLYTKRERGLVDSYLLQATRAKNRERFETARIYYQKLLQLDPFNRSYEYYIARSFDAQGKEEEAFLRMKKLLDSPLSGSVNYWFAIKTLDREDRDDETKWKLVRRHLNLFLKGRARHLQANQLATEINIKLADYYQTQDKSDAALEMLQAAEKHASTAASVEPKLNLRLARLQARLANAFAKSNVSVRQQQIMEEASESAERYIAFFDRKLDEKPDDIESLLFISDGYLFQKKFDVALGSLDTAISYDIGKKLTPELVNHKSNVLAAWAGHLLSEGTQDMKLCLELVDRSIQLNASNPRALGVFAQISVLKNKATSPKARAILDKAFSQSVAPFSVHMVLGSHAAKNKDYDLAVKHLRQAMLLDRKAPAVMNNLAYVLSRLAEPQYEEALALTESALKILPNNPHFLDTRGNIFLRMQQYELAFHDLELAEQRMKQNTVLYENLIMLSKRLGFESHQQKYEKRLESLLALQSKTTSIEN